MFSLCKTVKIYQTVNHYHQQDSQHSQSVESHQLQFQESSRPSNPAHEDLPIRTIESRNSILPKRYGINVSLRETDPNYSPTKRMALSSERSDFLRESKTHESNWESIKLGTTRREECDSPHIIQSKITWGEMSPRLKGYDPRLETRSTLLEQQLAALSFLPLKNNASKTTNGSSGLQSLANSNPQNSGRSSPLKKSTTFLRTSNAKSRAEDSLRNSVESNLQNTLNLRLTCSRPRRQQASESLLRLSCSSYSQIPDRQYQGGFEDLSQTCSLQLKKEESLLGGLGNQVEASIILEKDNSKQMKIVLSNRDLHRHRHSQSDFKPSLSNVLQGQSQSPVSKLRKRYGQNLLLIDDKQTIISKSIASRNSHQQKHVIDQSIIIQHQIQNKFIPINGKTNNYHNYRMFIAQQAVTRMIVTIKEVPLERMDLVNQQLNVYREIQQHCLDVAVAKLFQLYTHGGVYVLVKQPHQMTLQEYMTQHMNDHVLVSWQFIFRSIQDTLRKTITQLARKGLKLTKLISSQDIVHVMGEWQLHSPHMFSSKGEQIKIDQGLQLLRSEMFGRIGQNIC